MKRLHLVLLLVAWSVFSVAETGADRGVAKPLAPGAQTCVEAARTGAAADLLAQQPECCKGNKGVCGCRAGKIVCCDKTFSDTCTCNRDEGPGAS
ncbi:MAG: hypothetical protein ACT4PQ_14690 [Betaproteobacteria bacterium]